MLVSRCESACFAMQNPCFHLLRRTFVRPPTDWHAVKESSHPTHRDAPRSVRKLRTIKRSSALTVSHAPLYCLNASYLFTCRPILISSPFSSVCSTWPFFHRFWPFPIHLIIYMAFQLYSLVSPWPDFPFENILFEIDLRQLSYNLKYLVLLIHYKTYNF